MQQRHALTRMALEQAAASWGAKEIEISHLTGHGWPPHLAEVVVEAIWNLGRESGIRQVYFHECCLREEKLVVAIERIRRERDVGWGHRDLEWRLLADGVMRVELGAG